MANKEYLRQSLANKVAKESERLNQQGKAAGNTQ
jgi:hypothetical protein